MKLWRTRYVSLLGIFLATMVIASCSSDDGGGGSGGTPSSGPTVPETFKPNQALTSDPDVPDQVRGMAAGTGGMMAMGQGYMALATGDGTPAGDCWEWSMVDPDEEVAILVEACEETSGDVTWTVTITVPEEEPCDIMTGEVAADGLTGNWQFRNCECDSVILLTDWETNAEGTDWRVDMTIPPVECTERLLTSTEGDTLHFHYEEHPDGSGSGFVRQGADTLWTVIWQVTDDQVTGTYCWYEEGVEVDCIDFGFDREAAAVPGAGACHENGTDLARRDEELPR